MQFNDYLNQYIEAYNNLRDISKVIAKILNDAIEEVIPDIKYSLGWAEAGIDTISFWSNSHDVSSCDLSFKLNCYYLDDIIVEIFPELKNHIDAPYGVYLTKNESDKIRQVLVELKYNDIRKTINTIPRRDHNEFSI